MYYNDWNRPKQQANKPGKELEPIYKERMQKDGTMKLVEIGKTNTYEKIQADKDSCDIKKIMERHNIDATMLGLTKIEEGINDLTEMPTNIIDLQNKMIEAKETFNGMSTEIKEYYGNNFNKFIKAFGNGKITEDIEAIKQKNNIKTTLPGKMKMEEITTTPQVKTQDIVENPTKINTTSSEQGGIKYE